ncbi:hypothetical protein [Bradyrhizobium cosmicum]|uniref:hypothetical protein n=1 Tax=Bradyrhizobium cosmicum TaxID=1404864 RepID=UPI0028EBECE2|nr:hypothetical protein [Bradyrhizobium cosmicum]
MVRVGIVGSGIVVRCARGMLEAAKEIIEVRMRAARDTASALRLTFHDRDLHGINSGEGGDERCGPNVP